MDAGFRPPVREILIGAGILLLVVGLLWPYLSRYGGRLPGDMVMRRGGWTCFFPIVTSLVLSVLISLILWLFRR